MPSMSLIVLRTVTLEPMLTFYQALGLTFVQEQHGTGAIHYSTQLGDVTMEIFPSEVGQTLDRKMGGATMIGIKVESVDAAIETLNSIDIKPLSPAKDSAWGRRATVLDPDGRLIELNENKSA
ncbi:MAG: VOC family protein [Anaerolineae bacterium]|nr:VOC family protein [Anaerolineae bacterium]